MRKLIKKLSIKNKRRKLLTLLFVINLFVKSPKLYYSTFNKVKNNNNLSLEIIHRPSRGGAVFEVDAFDMFKVVKNNFKTPTDNKYNPFSLYLPPSPGVRERPPINFGTMSNAGLPLIKGQVKSQNDFLYRHLKVDPVFVNRKNPNPLKDCFPVPNVETLTGNFKDSTINLNPNPFKSKKLDDSVPQLFLLFLKETGELGFTKVRNVFSNIYQPNHSAKVVSCLIKKVRESNFGPGASKLNPLPHCSALKIDNKAVQEAYEKHQKLLEESIIGLPQKLDNQELKIIIVTQKYNQEILNIIKVELPDGFPDFLLDYKINQMVKDFKDDQRFNLPEISTECGSGFPTNSGSTQKPTLINDPKHNLAYKNFTYDRKGNNYSIPIGNETSKRSTFDGLTTEKLTFDRTFFHNQKTGFKIDFKQARDKFYHAKNFSVEFPFTFNQTEFNKKSSSEKRQNYLAKTIPMEAVNEFRMALKNHALDTNTQLIIGLHQEGKKEIPAYHLFNNKTRNNCFYYIQKDGSGDFRSGWTLRRDQITNLINTGNFREKNKEKYRFIQLNKLYKYSKNMVTTELDITRYLELLDLVDSLAKKEMSLSEKEYRELLSYQVIFENEIYFNQRQNYSALIEQYLEEKIDMVGFHYSFYKMWCQSRDQLNPMEEELKKNSISTISVDSRAKSYSYLINSIFYSNESLTDEGEYDIPEEEHRNEIKQIFGEMQELLQEE